VGEGKMKRRVCYCWARRRRTDRGPRKTRALSSSKIEAFQNAQTAAKVRSKGANNSMAMTARTSELRKSKGSQFKRSTGSAAVHIVDMVQTRAGRRQGEKTKRLQRGTVRSGFDREKKAASEQPEKAR
jgi:hypothetical protein